VTEIGGRWFRAKSLRESFVDVVNNWIDTTPQPKPSNAAIVNAYDALLARAKRCQAERGLKPTVLAVDFYRTGDLVKVVAELNR